MRFELPVDHPLAAGYVLRSCDICGTYFADVPGDLDLESHYNQGSIYADAANARGSARDPYDVARLEETAILLDRMVSISRNLPAIDIGTGSGDLLDALRSQGWTSTFGVDPSPACVAAVIRRGHIGQVASLGRPWPSLPGAGLVTLVHVLEHVLEPSISLRQAASLLLPGGYLYVEVPDAARYHEDITAPFQHLNTEHINHFSGPGLSFLLRRSGLRVIENGVRTIRISRSAVFPATWALATHGSHPLEIPQADPQLSEGMSVYLSKSESLLSDYDVRLRGILDAAGKDGISIWGCGQLLMRLLAETCLGSASIACLVDGNPVNHGRHLHGLMIQPPEALAAHPQPVLITSAIHASVIRRRLLLDMGLDRRTFTFDHTS